MQNGTGKEESLYYKYAKRISDGGYLCLNVGCGDNRIENYVGIDMHCAENVDLVHDIRFSPIPFPDESVDEIVFFHAIEHVETAIHPLILNEFWRLLKPGKGVYISYPEFEKIAHNWIVNFRGQREFWRNTIYGLQRYPGDYHVSLMNTPEFVEILKACGFTEIEYTSEPGEPYNTVVYAIKGVKPQSYEDLLNKAVYSELGKVLE